MVCGGLWGCDSSYVTKEGEIEGFMSRSLISATYSIFSTLILPFKQKQLLDNATHSPATKQCA